MMTTIPSAPTTEFRLALLNDEIDFLKERWGGLSDLNCLIRELADHALAPDSSAALARCPPHLEGRNLVMTDDISARQFVAHLLEVRPSLAKRRLAGDALPTDAPYDSRPIVPILRKIRGREQRKDHPNVAGYYKVFYRSRDDSGGFIASLGVIEVGPPPSAALHYRKNPDAAWQQLSSLGLQDLCFSGPYASPAEADGATNFRP